MAYGFQTRYVTLTDRLTRIIGYVNATTAAGSITVPAWADPANGQPWHAQTTPQINPGGAGRVVTISGTTLSWSAGLTSTVITYGVF